MKRKSFNYQEFGMTVHPAKSTLRIALSRMHVGPVVGAVVLALLSPAKGQDAAQYFKTNCMSCHTIGGGRLVGPDLKDVTQRRDRDWLIRFMKDPQAVINSGDPVARQLLEEYGGVMMPASPGMTDAVADRVLELIEAESAREDSPFKGVQVSDRPFMPKDIRHGRDLFTGRHPLESGGPACIACHTLPQLGALGGGELGPDLTKAIERLGGRSGLSAWLSAPATPTMQALYQHRPLDSEEILALVACMQDAAQNHSPTSPALGRFIFLLIGVMTAVAGLSALNRIWSRRIRNISPSLVHEAHAKVLNERST